MVWNLVKQRGNFTFIFIGFNDNGYNVSYQSQSETFLVQSEGAKGWHGGKRIWKVPGRIPSGDQFSWKVQGFLQPFQPNTGTVL